MPKIPIPLPPELEAAASAVLEENAKTPAPEQRASEAIEVGPLRFRRPTLGDLETLRLLQSPWLARIQGGGDDAACRDDLLALMDVVFLWTRPPAFGRELVRKGAGVFHAAASEALLDAPLAVTGDLLAAVNAVLAREFGG